VKKERHLKRINHSVWRSLILIRWEKSIRFWKNILKYQQHTLCQRGSWFHHQIWDLKHSLTKTLAISKDNSSCRLKCITRRLVLKFLTDTNMISEILRPESKTWRNLCSIGRSLKRARGLRLVTKIQVITSITSWDLTWTRRCSIPETCSSRSRKKEPIKEVRSWMRISGWRFVILVTDAGPIITFQLRSKRDSIDLPKSSSVKSTTPLLTTGLSLVWCSRWPPEISYSSHVTVAIRSTLRMMITWLRWWSCLVQCQGVWL